MNLYLVEKNDSSNFDDIFLLESEINGVSIYFENGGFFVPFIQPLRELEIYFVRIFFSKSTEIFCCSFRLDGLVCDSIRRTYEGKETKNGKFTQSLYVENMAVRRVWPLVQ